MQWLLDEARRYGPKLRSFFQKYAPPGRRLLFLVIVFGIWTAWNAWPETVSFFRQLLDGWIEDFRTGKDNHPLGQLLWPGRELALKFIATILYTYAALVAGTVFVKSIAFKGHALPDARALVELLVREIGIIDVFHSASRYGSFARDYKSEVQLAVLNAKKVRMLSIAGYEWLGKGADSLLYKIISEKKDLDFECIVLNREEGREVIQRRCDQLRERDQTIQPTRLKEEIGKTLQTIAALNREQRKVAIKAFSCNWHPVFRLLICDDVLFVSSYRGALHGHESPICKIAKEPFSGSTTDTWFHSFETFYESLKANCKKVVD